MSYMSLTICQRITKYLGERKKIPFEPAASPQEGKPRKGTHTYCGLTLAEQSEASCEMCKE